MQVSFFPISHYAFFQVATATMSTSSQPRSSSSSLAVPSTTTMPASRTSNSSSTTSPPPPSSASQIAEARLVLSATMTNIGHQLSTDLQSRAQTLHSNTAALSKQEKNLITATKKLEKDTDALKKVADKGLKELKAVGNLGNWAEVVDRDLKVLEETLKLVREGGGGAGEWDDSSGSESGDFEPCRICGVEGGEEKIVLCDGTKRRGSSDAEGERCDGPFHYDCLGLSELPQGPWFCAECRALRTVGRREGVLGKLREDGDEDGDGDVVMGGIGEEDSRVYNQDEAAFQRDDGAWS